MPKVFDDNRGQFTNLVSVLQASVEQFADRPLFGVLRNGAIDWTTFKGFSELVDQFRATYPEIVIPRTVALPGAAAALAAVRELGGRTLVVTAKHTPNAGRHLAALGWRVDHLAGDLWSTGKAEALRRFGAGVYVGDHETDMAGALAADAVPVGVTTGPCDAQRLRAAGAAVVLDSLTEFPDWLRGHRA